MEKLKNNFNKQDLLSKLNSKIEDDSSAKFIDAENLGNGKYSLTVQLSGDVFNQTFKPSNNFSTLIQERSHNSPLLEKKRLEQESNLLKARLENALVKDIINNPKEAAALNTRYRDKLDNSYLDLRGESADLTEATKLYTRSEEEYYRTGIYGTTIDVLSNFASTGFYNEINDIEIKEYYDSWNKDVLFLDIVKKAFHNLFKYSVCYILNAKGSYEPNLDGVSSIPGKTPSSKTRAGLKAHVALVLNEFHKKTTGQAMDYEKFSKLYDSREFAASDKIPIAYTVLDPKFIKVTNSGFFNKPTVTILSKGLKPLADFIKKYNDDKGSLSESAKASLKLIPSKMKNAATEGSDYTFADDEISVIYLRKEDFETYSKPRGSRAFDSFDYKDELKKADFATIDGIYNYILKVTVGDDKNPVTDSSVLESLAEAFNTPQKAFTIVWNHTLKIEKITSQEVSSILGKTKYEPVNEDITAALGIARALIDGTNVTGDAAILATKALQSEINAARQQVEYWIYQQYKLIAKTVGYASYPVIRWKESVINTDGDAVTRASFMQMLDRKAISIQTYMREMGLDYNSELQRLQEELPFIQEDVLRAGSPYQGMAKAAPVAGDQGRPKGQPTTTKQPTNDIKVVKRKTEVTSPSQASEEESITNTNNLVDILLNLNKTELEAVLTALTTSTTDDTDKGQELHNNLENITETANKKKTLKEFLEE